MGVLRTERCGQDKTGLPTATRMERSVPKDGVGVRSGATVAAEDVAQLCLHDNACGVVSGMTVQLPPEPLQGADDGGHEILRSPSLRRYRLPAEGRNPVIEELKQIDIDSLSPMEALMKLKELKDKV